MRCPICDTENENSDINQSFITCGKCGIEYITDLLPPLSEKDQNEKNNEAILSLEIKNYKNIEEAQRDYKIIDKGLKYNIILFGEIECDVHLLWEDEDHCDIQYLMNLNLDKISDEGKYIMRHQNIIQEIIELRYNVKMIIFNSIIEKFLENCTSLFKKETQEDILDLCTFQNWFIDNFMR